MAKSKEFNFHCNNCYGCPTKEEGCFTNDVEAFITNKDGSCLDGTWDDGIEPKFQKLKTPFVVEG